MTSMIDAHSNRLKIFHFLLYSFGLLAVSYQWSYLLGTSFASSAGSTVHFYEWVSSSVETRKPAELLSYIVPTAILFFYYIFAYSYMHYSIHVQSRALLTNLVSPHKIAFYVTLACGVNLYPLLGWFDPSVLHFSIYGIAWLITFLYPLGLITKTSYISTAKLASMSASKPSLQGLLYIGDRLSFLESFLTSIKGKVLGGMLLSLLLIQIWWTFLPYIVGTPVIYNDYLNIPEQTVTDSGYIDNLTYINTHRLGGLLLRDPRTSIQRVVLKPGEDYIILSQSTRLRQYLATNPEMNYDNKLQGLFVDGLMTNKDTEELCRIVTAPECERVKSFYHFNEAQANRHYSPEELSFIQKNMFDLGNQLAIGHYFFHHATLFGPVNELSLHKPPSRILPLYGWLNTYIVEKVMQAKGGVSIAAYLKATYIFYPIYYSLIILASLLIFRSLWLSLLVGIICFGGMYLLSYEAVRMSPGFNPLRHFFDIFVLMCFYGYLFSKKNNTLYLVLTAIFTTLTFLCDKEFGLFVIGGLVFAFIIKATVDRRIKYLDVMVLLSSVVTLGAATLLIKTGSGPYQLYYILGIMLPHADVLLIAECLLIVNVIYAFLLFYCWHDDRSKIFFSYFFGFLQLTLVYFVWNPSPNHFYSLILPWSFLISILFYDILRNKFLVKIREVIVVLAILPTFFLYYFPAMDSYFVSQRNLKTVFNEHKIYHWGLARAQYDSTMDPGPFEDAIKLIKKYEASSAIYIISRYDNILPFMAEKYSAMPFVQLSVGLLTEAEMSIASQAILNDKPKYLFVDSHLLENNRGEIARKIDPALSVYQLSKNHYMAFNENLVRLFKMVESQYEMVQPGQLISVYQRKNPNA